ncbi:MAG: hypothetical protein A3A85_05260, partial [Deltaproteobacteria bacterium RIFCSPLOWO2_01_FULL_42_9]
TSKGYVIVEATDGETAIDKVYKERPDLILMDIQLPKFDGAEITRRLREDSSIDTTIIIAITAHAMKGDKETFLKSGFNDYVSKPINISSLLQTIENHLHGSVSRKS